MSVIRPILSANFFDIYEVDVFVPLQPVTVTGVSNGGSSLVVGVSDPNSGADHYLYGYYLYRSVDGSPFVANFYGTGAVVPSIADNIYTVSSSAVVTIMTSGLTATLPPTAYVTSGLPVPPGVLTSPTVMTILFDTVASTPTGTIVIPAGDVVTVDAGFTLASATVPPGHTYSYEVSAQNKYATTAVSAPSPIAVASAFTAQTLGVPTRVDNVISLSWTDPNTYSAGNRIEVWRQLDSGDYELVSNIVKDSGPMPVAYADAFDFFSLLAGTYSYKIRPVSDLPQDTGPFSAAQSIVVPATLSAPTGLSATIGSSQINLAWTDPNSPSSESGLNIYRYDGSLFSHGPAFAQIATVPPGATAYADTTIIIPGQFYSYEVEAFNQLQSGPRSSYITVAPPLLPATITSVVPASDVGAIVAWTAPVTDQNTEETFFALQRSVNGGPFITIAPHVSHGDTVVKFQGYYGPMPVPILSISYEDSFSEPAGTFIAYRVQAFNTLAVSPWSATVQVVLGAQLVAPDNVKVAITGASKIVVSWNDISPLVRGTSVYRSVNDSPLSLIAVVAASVTAFEDDLPIVSGAVYAYSVQNFDNQEQGPASAPLVATTPFDPPQNLQIVGTPGATATLSWTTNNSSMDYTSIETAFANGGTFVETARVPPGQTTAIVAISGTPGAAVSFRIREVKQPWLILDGVQVPQNLGRYSLTVSTDAALSAPSSVTVTRPTQTQNVVSWADANTEATGFQVWRQTVSAGPVYGAPIMVANDSDPTLRSWSDTFPMGMGDTVRYWVYAVDADNSSPQSNVAVLSARMGKPRIMTSQTARAQITLVVDPPPGYSFVAGDQVRISRSVNGAAMAVLATVPASASPITYVDSALAAPANIGDVVSYSAFAFSATESGPNSDTVDQVLYDAVFMPLGAVNTVRIAGSRNSVVAGGRGVFCGCANGIVKVANDPVTLEPVLTQSVSDYAGTTSIQSSDLTRVVAAGAGNLMYLIDAATLGRVVAPISTVAWSGASNDSGLFDVSIVGQSAGFSGSGQSWGPAGIGVYDGWALAVHETTNVRGIAPWDSAVAEFQNWDRTLVTTTPIQPFTALPFSDQAGASVQPLRLEAVGGDGLCPVLQTDSSGSTTAYNTTLFRVQRSTNRAIEVFNIPNYVLDFVSDSESKVLAVDITGAIWLIDMSLVPSSAGAGYLRYNPLPIGAVIGRIPLPSVYVPPPPATPPVGHPGDLLALATGSIAIELGAGTTVATALYNGASTTVHVFAAPAAPLALDQTLSLVKTYAVDERIGGLAFDGGKFFYGRSIDTSKLFRFDAGL